MKQEANKKSGLGFRKTALTKTGPFKPARAGMTAGFGKKVAPPKGKK